MKWFGHLLRLPKTTPARKALENFITPTKQPIRRPKTTWLSIIFNDIKKYSDIEINNKNIKINIDFLENLCSNRKEWNKLVGSMMLNKLTTMQ